MKERNKKGLVQPERYVRETLFLLGLFFISSAVYVWFTGSHDWYPLGIKVRLHTWEKPWWIGTGLWLIASFTSNAPFLALSIIGRGLHRALEALGFEADTSLKRWSLAGFLVGSFSGILVAQHYLYLFPSLLYRIAFVIAWSGLMATVHALFAFLLEDLFARLIPRSRPGQRASFRQGLYILTWAALVWKPLPQWEAFYTEPVFTQAAVSLLLSFLLSWVLFRRWSSLKSPANWLKNPPLLATLVMVLAVGIYSHFRWLASHDSPQPRDRVLLITIDTVRADHLSCYGYHRLTSPTLDRVAASGVRFERAFCPMGITDPSHVSMFTGVYPRTHGVVGVFNQKMTGEAASLVEFFQDRGYATGAVISRTQLNPHDIGLPGFEYASEPCSYVYSTSAREAFRRAANWLEEHRGQSIFLWVHFFDPHISYEYHAGFTDRFTEDYVDSKGGGNWLDPEKFYSKEDVQIRVDLYDGEIAYMDHWIERLLKRVNTLEPESQRPPFVAVIADHGEMLGERQDPPVHYGFGHGGILYNEVAHIPFILSWPGLIAEGKTIEDVVEVTDLAPTMAEYVLGINDFPASGQSLRSVIESVAATDQKAFIQRRLFEEDPPRPFLEERQYVVVQWPYKLFMTLNGDVELYDLSGDWKEERDLSGSRPEQVKKMAEELAGWMRDTPEAELETRDLTPSQLKAMRALGYIQ